MRTKDMFVIRASGGEYDEAWEKNFFLVEEKEIAEIIVGYLRVSMSAFREAGKIYYPLESAVSTEWFRNNKKPEFTSANVLKPTHPILHPSIQGVHKNIKKDNPYHKIYLD